MPEKSQLWYLKNINILEGMDDSQIKIVETMTTMAHVNKRQPIYFPEQPSNNIFS